MLPKAKRASTKNIDLLFKEGRIISSPSLIFRFILPKIKTQNTEETSRISFIAPKNISKLAVKRNSLRRLGYRVLGGHVGEFPPGIIGAFTFRRYEKDTSALENEIKNILAKIT